MTTLTKTTPLLLLLTLSLMVGGCLVGGPEAGGDPSDAETDTAGDPGAHPDAATEGPGEGVATDGHEWSSPVADALGEASNDGDDAEKLAKQTAVDDLTVACMANEGFTYHPAAPQREVHRYRSELTSEEFAATYGFGITTLDASGAAGEDPNASMLAEMSSAEQEAWNSALWGASADAPAEGDGWVAEPVDTGGCKDEAMAEVYGADTRDRDAVTAFEPLLRDLASLYDQIQRDPRVSAAAEEYSVCLTDAGHPGYSVDGDDPPSPTGAVLERLAETFADTNAVSDPERADRGDLSALEPSVLAELRALEIDLAVADVACRGGYREVHHEVTYEFEKQWVEANRAELEAYRDAANPEQGR